MKEEKKKQKKEKKFQYSKMLPIVSGLIFIACLYRVFSIDIVNYTDLTVYATALTVSAGIWGSAIIWYMKKAQSENTIKLKMELYKVSSQARLEYNEQMMILRKKYHISDEEMYEIENDSFMDEFEGSALSDVEMTINSAQSEADSSIELQNY